MVSWVFDSFPCKSALPACVRCILCMFNAWSQKRVSYPATAVPSGGNYPAAYTRASLLTTEPSQARSGGFLKNLLLPRLRATLWVCKMVCLWTLFCGHNTSLPSSQGLAAEADHRKVSGCHSWTVCSHGLVVAEYLVRTRQLVLTIKIFWDSLWLLSWAKLSWCWGRATPM